MEALKAKLRPVFWEDEPERDYERHTLIALSEVHWRELGGDMTLCGLPIPQEKVDVTRYLAYERCDRCESLGGRVSLAGLTAP